MYGLAEIYGLKDPRYPQIEYMYVGYTTGCSRKRLSFHKWAGTAPVRTWIDSLRVDGKEPILHILDKVYAAEGPSRERELIEKYNPPLNQRKGGGGIRKKTGGWSEPRDYKQYSRDKKDLKRLAPLEEMEALGDEIYIINGQYYSDTIEWGSYSDYS